MIDLAKDPFCAVRGGYCTTKCVAYDETANDRITPCMIINSLKSISDSLFMINARR